MSICPFPYSFSFIIVQVQFSAFHSLILMFVASDIIIVTLAQLLQLIYLSHRKYKEENDTMVDKIKITD